MSRGEFDAGEAAYEKLSAKFPNETVKERVRLLYLQLKVIHARDANARAELEKATKDPKFGEHATALLAYSSRTVGDTDAAAEIYNRAAELDFCTFVSCQAAGASA